VETVETMETVLEIIYLSCFEDRGAVSIEEKCGGDSGDREIEVAVSTVSSEEKCGGDRDDFKQPLTRAHFSYCLQCLQCLHPKKAFFGSVFSKPIFGDLPNVPDVPDVPGT
jgi:hypothetical protein